MPPNEPLLLGGSIILDDTLGPERIVAVVCDMPVPPQVLVAAARSALAGAGGDPRLVERIATGCRETSLVIEKAARTLLPPARVLPLARPPKIALVCPRRRSAADSFGGHSHPVPAACARILRTSLGACTGAAVACPLQLLSRRVRIVIVVATLLWGCFQPPDFGIPASDSFAHFDRTDFERGCDTGDDPACSPDATYFGHTLHTVVSPFDIQIAEVTQGEYDRCVRAPVDPCRAPEIIDYAPGATPELPVRGVAYDDAVRYCALLQRAGAALAGRLPTEAEWECAAGECNGTHVTYPWGEAVPTCELGNFSGCAGHVEAAHDAGRTPRGMRDLGGNLREWVVDFYENPYDLEPIDPFGPDSGTLRVVRGGSFRSPDRSTLRVYARDTADPAARDDGAIGDIGFRCVFGEGD